MPDPKKPSAEAVKASQELAIWLVERVGPFKPGLPVDATLVVADTIDLHFAPRIAALEAEIGRLRAGLEEIGAVGEASEYGENVLVCRCGGMAEGLSRKAKLVRKIDTCRDDDKYCPGAIARAALAEGEKEGKA